MDHDCSRVYWDTFVQCQVRANETYSEAKHQFSARNRDVLMNAQSHKWWCTLKSSVFGLSSLLPPLVGGGGGLVCESVGKADLLSDHLGKQSRESVDLLLTCHSSSVLPPLPSGRVRSGISCLNWTLAQTLWVCFLFFLRKLMFWPLVSVLCFGGLFFLAVSRLAGDRPMSLLFQRVHHSLLLPTNNRFP